MFPLFFSTFIPLQTEIFPIPFFPITSSRRRGRRNLTESYSSPAVTLNYRQFYEQTLFAQNAFYLKELLNTDVDTDINTELQNSLLRK